MWVKRVPDRANILIHTGNVPKDTRGCIIVGEKFDFGAPFIANSVAAYKKLYDLIKIHIEGSSGVALEVRDKAATSTDIFKDEAVYTIEERERLLEKDL